MEKEILKFASTQGLWAVLTVFLVFYILRAQEKRDLKQEEREKNYQRIISKLTDKLNIIDEAKNDIKAIRDHVCKNKM